MAVVLFYIIFSSTSNTAPDISTLLVSSSNDASFWIHHGNRIMGDTDSTIIIPAIDKFHQLKHYHGDMVGYANNFIKLSVNTLKYI